MKTFKEYVSEGFSNAGMPVVQQQWSDNDALPSAETAVEALNAFVGAIGDHEYMNPKIAFKKLEENLQKLGYHFDMPTIDGGVGEYSLPLRYGNGTFEAFIRFKDGKVDAYGRLDDFDSTRHKELLIKKAEGK